MDNPFNMNDSMQFNPMLMHGGQNLPQPMYTNMMFPPNGPPPSHQIMLHSSGLIPGLANNGIITGPPSHHMPPLLPYNRPILPPSLDPNMVSSEKIDKI